MGKTGFAEIGQCYFISDNISIIAHMTKEQKSFDNLEKKVKLFDRCGRSRVTHKNLKVASCFESFGARNL